MSTWNPDQSATLSIEPDLRSVTTQTDFDVGDSVAPVGERYADQGLIGAGGGGEVRRVHDRRLDRSVARKTMLVSQLADAKALRRFVREARVTARLDHPGIIPIHEVGRDPELGVWFTMKEVRGRTLGEVIEAVHAASPPDGWGETADGWTFARLVDALRRVAEAVGYAHSQGVVHRDLKPANVMIGAFGEVFVMDWGLARVPGDVSDEQRVMAGTPAYMSPEQALGGFAQLGSSSDVHALGLLLHVVITGEEPFPGETAEAVIDNARMGLDRRREHLRPVPSELLRLLEVSTAVEPERRPGDGTAFAEWLRRWQEGARRRERARALLEEAEQTLAQVESDEPRCQGELARVERELAALPSWTEPETRRPLWEREDQVRSELVELETQRTRAVEQLRLAIAEDPSLGEARNRLSSLFESRLMAAERRGDHLRAAHLAEQLRTIDGARFTAHSQRTGRISLATSRPAHARLYRVVEQGRRKVEVFERDLGACPLVAVRVDPGSWVVALEAPDCEPVRYPIFIERGAHWDGIPPGARASGGGVVAIPGPGRLGGEDRYVPGSWFRSTIMLAGTEVVGPRWRWVDGFVMRRCPVSIAEYGRFLEDLVRTGRRDEAEACMPRYKLPGAPGMFEIGADDACRLRPDPDGDELSPDWPVFLVHAEGADAYAAWESGRTGHTWRLPWSFEREKAARGVDGRLFPWGDEAEAPFAVTRGWRPGRALPHPVDAAPVDVSVYGIAGLAGGIQDWCRDRWTDDPTTGEDVHDSLVAASGAEARVALGGSWNFSAMVGCAGNRFQRLPDRRMESLGFRLVRSLVPADMG